MASLDQDGHTLGGHTQLKQALRIHLQMNRIHLRHNAEAPARLISAQSMSYCLPGFGSAGELERLMARCDGSPHIR